MAIKDEDRSVRVEPRKKKPKKAAPPSSPVRGEQATGGSKVPTRSPYKPKPSPAFERVGFTGGSIFDFNERVAAASYAYESNFNREPSPGLLIDLVRAPVTTQEYQDLFSNMPTSFQRARAMLAIESDVSEASAIPNREGGAAPDAIGVEEYEGQRSEDIRGGSPDLLAERIGPGEAEEIGGVAKALWGVPVLAASQLAESALMAPVGIGMLAYGGSRDVFDIVSGHDFTPSRTTNMAKLMGESIAEDFRHPLENPGYLLMDVTGLVSAGAGFGARLGAASRATTAIRTGGSGAGLNLRAQTVRQIERGNTARSVLSALVRRPLPGTFEIGPAGATERVLLSENAARRAVQRQFYRYYQRQIRKHLDADPSVINGQHWLKELRKSIISPEKTLGRTAAARVRVERDVLLAPVHNLNKATGTSLNLAAIYKRLPLATKVSEKARAQTVPGANAFGLSIGEEMAILFRATDDIDPAGWWQRFHENMLDLGIGDPAAHKAKLAAIPLGVEALRKPSKRLQRSLQEAEKVSHEMQSLKMRYLGLDPTDAENRIAASAEAMRISADAPTKSDVYKRVDELIGGPPLSRLTEDAFYYPEVRRHDAPIFPKEEGMGFARSSGKYGIPFPNIDRLVPELSHRYEAKAIRAGDTVVDARLLLGSAFAKAAKGVTLVEDWKRLLALSVETPNAPIKSQGGFLRPIRTLDGVPEELKKELAPFFEERTVSAKEAAQFADKADVDDLHRYFFPDPSDIEGVEGVRWVDERVFADLHRVQGEPSRAHKVYLAVNESLKVTAIYGKPSYIINALSNAGMLVIQQGFGAPVSMYKSLTANKTLGRDVVAVIDSLIGDSKSLSFTPDGIKAAKLSRSMAEFWNILVDRWMRRAAFIWEANRQGVKTADDFRKLLDGQDLSAETVGKRVEISRRANKAMVEFNNLTWFEKTAIKDYVFVYPWVSRSAVWSLRTWMEHPLKTWGVTELGQIGEEHVTEAFAEIQEAAGALVPEWFKDAGYVPLSVDDDGAPWIVNLNSVNTFSTVADLMQTAEGAVTDDPFRSLEDVLGPGAELVVRGVTGRNKFGQKYEHGVVGAFADVMGNLPQTRAFARAEKQKPVMGPDGKPLPISSSYQDVTSTGQAAPPSQRPTFIPGMWDAYGPLLSGGLWPRKADMEALEEDYWKEQPTKVRGERRAEIAEQRLRERNKDEMRTIRGMEEITSTILGRPIPKGVNDALSMIQKAQDVNLRFAIYNRRQPTDAEKRDLQIGMLEEQGRITPETAEELREDLAEAIEEDNLTRFTIDFGNTYLSRRELLEWHAERNTVLEVSNNIQSQADYLRQSGLWTGVLPKGGTLATPQTLAPSREKIKRDGGVDFDLDSPIYQVGREFLEYEKQLAAHEPAEASYLEGVRGAEFRVWIDSQDKPITIDGRKYPSPVRLAFASKMLSGTIEDPDYEARQIAGLSVQGWDTLTEFEKEIVGKPAKKGVTEGWLVYQAVTGALRANVTDEEIQGVTVTAVDGTKVKLSDYLPEAPPPGDRTVEKDHRIAIAKWVNKHFAPGFFDDFLYSELPKWDRLRYLPVAAKSPNREGWTELLGVARTQYAWVEQARAYNDGIGGDPGFTITEVQDGWRDYVTRTLLPWYRENDAEFLAELERYGGIDFLRTLIDD